jgi:Domain of unknown function(DUF2779)
MRPPMAHPVSLSKTKLLAYLQCPRKLWLEQYSPELEDEGALDRAGLETGRVVGVMARSVFGANGGHHISAERGLRAMVATTEALIAADFAEPIFEATFDYDGLTVQVDMLDRREDAMRIVEVKSSASVKPHHIDDCAIQAWTLEQLGLPVQGVAVAHIDPEFVYAGDGDYTALFVEEDVTAEARERAREIPAVVAGARSTLEALDEPAAVIGEHCRTPYICPFFEHCAPAQGEYPVTALGGRTETLYALMLEGYSDLRDVPEARLTQARQRRIRQQTRLGAAYAAPALREFAARLERPCYYLDFETIGFAAPIWEGTRPYEALPFQWSCHVDTGSGRLEHREFLDVSGRPPMRACAEALVETLGSEGPILVYTGYEARVIGDLAARYPDLAQLLDAIRARIVDLYPLVKEHYYHPAMRGSWSLKAVLPTVAPELDYAELGEVRDGVEAQSAFLEAIAPGTSAARRAALQNALSDYCRYDTLAMVELVAFFAAA